MAELDVTFDADGTLHLGPRVIPIPTSISEAARAFLARPFPIGPEPAVEDKEAWKAQVAAFDGMIEPIFEQRLKFAAATVETRRVAGVTVHVATPRTMRHPDRAHLKIHGGAWIYLGGKFAMGEAAMAAADFGCTTFGLDYRMPPDHPFPAAVEDGLAVYRDIIKQYDPAKIAISGASAGGNLSGAVTLKIRDSGLPMPAAVGLLTPATDLTRASDTLVTNAGIDTVLRPLSNVIALYAAGHDLRDPYLSPVYGDFTKGYPPTFLQSGTRDLLLSDTVRMHRALRNAGVRAELNVWEAMPHGGFGGVLYDPPAPEDLEMTAALVEFVDRMLG